MQYHIKGAKTLQDVLDLVEQCRLPQPRRHDMTSAVKRICEMGAVAPAAMASEATALRPMLAKILPAAHGVKTKDTWTNILSLFRAALRLAGVIDVTLGTAAQDPLWAPLVKAAAGDTRSSCGLACFFKWCASRAIAPDAVDDAVVLRFLAWLETRTLRPRPHDVVRFIPNLWNEMAAKSAVWPRVTLSILSFRLPPKRIQWADLPESLRHDAEAYLAMRGNPDLFDERPNAPRRALAARTLHQQREHIRLAASVLIENDIPKEDIKSLADLVEAERFKLVLRRYLGSDGKPNAFVIGMGKTLIQVAYYHVGADAEHLARLRAIAAKLPPIPFDLTAKNAALLRQFESPKLRAKLLYLPETLIGEVKEGSKLGGRLRFVEAQVAIAIDIALVIPLRPQNLCSLVWRRHFSEPDGPKGRLLLHIPAAETKSKRKDVVAEIPEDVAKARWYRQHILSRLNADPNGPLFVTQDGTARLQDTLSDQIIKVIEDRLGVHMPPHTFRHLAATLYLEEHPEDFETVRALLGHAFGKTTMVYAGNSHRRGAVAYGKVLQEKRQALKLSRPHKPTGKKKPT